MQLRASRALWALLLHCGNLQQESLLCGDGRLECDLCHRRAGYHCSPVYTQVQEDNGPRHRNTAATTEVRHIPACDTVTCKSQGQVREDAGRG